MTVPDFKIYSVKAKDNYWELEKKKWQYKVAMQRPWTKMKWEKIEDEIKRFKDFESYEVVNYMHSLELWVKKIKDTIPEMINAIEKITKQILDDTDESEFNEVVKKHILSQYIFTCYHGRLDANVLLKRCITPEKTIELAKALNIRLSERPEDL